VKSRKKKSPPFPPALYFLFFVLVLVFSVLVLVLVLDYSCFLISGCIFFCGRGWPGPRPAYWFLVFIVHVDLAELTTVGVFKQISDGCAALNGRLVRYFNPQVRFSVPL